MIIFFHLYIIKFIEKNLNLNYIIRMNNNLTKTKENNKNHKTDKKEKFRKHKFIKYWKNDTYMS